MAEEAVTTPDATPEYLPFYCPGCGRQYKYERECIGSLEAPHKPIEVVSTNELKGDHTDPANVTAAPPSE